MAGSLVRGLWLAVSVALITGLGVASPARADDPEDTPPAADVVVRPDWVSASVTARASGVRVEVLSERSETSQVFVDADGTVVEETAFAPVRFRDEAGSEGWREIDTTLVAAADGSVSPVAMPVDVVLGTGAQDVVVFDDGGPTEVALSLEGVTLPTPVLDGSTALYPEVFEGVDVSVEVRSAGFEVLWLVKTPTAAKLLSDRFGSGGEVVFPARLRSKSVGVATADGGIEFTQVGKRLGWFGSPVAWDSASATPGERGAQTRVGFQLGKAQAPGKGRGLGVGLSKAWLTAKERVFPVVIDPTYATASGGPVFDAFVQEGYSSDQSGATELKLGDNGAGQVARSYLNFNASLFKGRQIVSASLSLFESWSWNCTARSFSAYDSGVASTSTRWTSQPAIGVKRASLSVAKGYSSSCPAARVSLDMTGQAKAWSATTASTVGMMLRADSETDSTYWKRFHSSEGSYKPVLSVSYSRVPDVPVAPSVAGLTSAATSAGVKGFVGVKRPVVSVPVKDADADTVTAVFERFGSASATTGGVEVCRGSAASGGTVSCTPTADLPGNSTVWIRGTAYDGRSWSGWGPAVEVRTAFATPLTPTIACVSGDGSWEPEVAAAEACTITARFDAANATSAPTSVWFRIDGGSWQSVSLTQITANTLAKTVTVGGTAGGHRVEAYAKSPGGIASATGVYAFGYGAPSLTAPASTVTTHGAVTVSAVGAPKAGAVSVTGAVQWRLQGASAWQDTAATVTAGAAESTLLGSFDTDAVLAADPSLPTRTSVVFEVRAKFLYGSTAVYTGSREVVRVPHAFGAGFPVADVTGGQVALWTGELQTSAVDAEVATPGGGLSISRTHSTFAGDPSIVQGVFGPGWTASLDGGPSGVSHMELVDNTRVDGTVVLVDADGGVLPFAQDDATVRTTATIPVGVYGPVGPDAEASDLTLHVTGSGTGLLVTARDGDGIETVFKIRTAATGSSDAELIVDGVTDAVTGEKTSYRYDQAGRVSAIIAPNPDGVTAPCTPGTLADGCRLLRLDYATATGGGDYTGRLKTVTAQVNQTTQQVASFTYDTLGRLISQTDTVTDLTTAYTWDATSSRLASVTPPGQATISYQYTDGKLAKVTRPVPASAGGGTAQLASILYQVAPSGIGGLDLTQFNAYQLPRAASTGFAVFGPDAVVSSQPAAGSELWRRADVWLTDDQGYTIHQGRYGAGQWQLTATIYDATDNVIEAWDTRATAAIRDGAIVNIAAAATSTKYNDALMDGDTILVPAGTRVTDVLTPAAMIRATGAGTPEMLRRHVATVYDQGAPQPGLSLPTTVTITAERPGGVVAETLSTTFTGYDKTETSDEKSGWDLRQATSVTLDMNNNQTADAADVRRETRYDQRGRIIEQRQPGAATGDPGTRRTVYWSAGTNPVDGACGNQPAWAGYVCSEGPASGTLLPVTRYSNYLWHGAAATETETSGAVTRTTTTSFNPQARPVTVSTAVTGLTGSTPVPAVTTAYDAYGQVTSTTSAAGTAAYTYDSWGRQLTYTITPPAGSPETTTSTYNALGDLVTVTTPKSTTTYTYDGLDANGTEEYRGLLTRTSTTPTGGQAWTASAAYDAHGAVTTEQLPGQIRRDTLFDLTGELVSQQYFGPVTDPDTSTTEVLPWLGWGIEADAAGRIVHEWNPDGAAHTGDLGVTAAKADLTYTYDPAGRLTTVTDHTDTSCTLRTYTFDKRGNRTSQGAATSTDGTCPTTATSSVTRAYDAADRPDTAADGQGAYLYDELGRQTLIPATDTPTPASGNITLGYFDDDTAKTITQAGTTLTYSLDVAGRRSTQTTTVNAATTSVVSNHYTDSSDSPGWITTLAGGVTSTTVYAELVGSDLGLSLITDDAGQRGELALTTPRGDIAATTTLTTPTTPATGLDSYTRYTEYGQPDTPQPQATAGAAGNGYGWLGAKQRTTTLVGILLMGARLYNTATGLFTSIDPVYGGNDTPYTYPNDPINKQDTTGREGFWKAVGQTVWKYKWDILMTAAMFVPGVGAAAWVYKGYRLYRTVKAMATGAKAIRPLKASRITSRIAGRFWVGRGASRAPMRNGKRMLQQRDWTPSTGRSYRPPSWKNNQKSYSSNFEIGEKGRHTYVDIHVKHRRWW